MAYNILTPYSIITNGDMSGDITSAVVETALQDNIGIQLNWSGTPNGIFSVQVSMDHRQDSLGNVLVAGNWIDLVLDPSITATGAPDVAYIDLNQLSAPYVRVMYTSSSSTGVLNAFVTGKGV